MADFNVSIINVLKNEGGFNKNLGDGQGMTYCGLTEVSDYTWTGWAWLKNWINTNGYPKEERVFPELADSVKAFYKKKYWGICKGDKLVNQNIGDILLSFCVASGGWAKQTNIAINKATGSKLAENSTFSDAAVQILNINQIDCYNAIYKQRLAYMQSLSSWSIYGKSWTRMMSMFPTSINVAVSKTIDAIKNNKIVSVVALAVVTLSGIYLKKKDNGNIHTGVCITAFAGTNKLAQNQNNNTGTFKLKKWHVETKA